MGVVSPIKNQETIERMKEHLRDRNLRNYLIFRMGINLGIPMNHLLQLKVEDVREKAEFSFEGYRIRISESLQKEIEFFIGNRKEGFLFRSGKNSTISRFQLYNILKEAADAAGYRGTVGTLTLRKTFAYWAYREQKIYLSVLSKYLGHHTTSYTLNFIDAQQEESVDEVCIGEMDM